MIRLYLSISSTTAVPISAATGSIWLDLIIVFFILSSTIVDSLSGNAFVSAWQPLSVNNLPILKVRPTSWATTGTYNFNCISRCSRSYGSIRIPVSQHQNHPRLFPVKQTTTVTTTTLYLANKLWDRLQIEEDDEPMWYLLNCVATNEIDLLRQCRVVFANNHENPSIKNDVIKFVVPIEKKTRSHGANKMITETKVKYPGYVFAKLRLCPYVYEAIQNLDLCRSWMGTVNHKGYKKLPPVPLALNEIEVENFGLEDVIEDIDYDNEASKNNNQISDGIIVDNTEDEEEEHEEYTDPMYKNVDKKALKQYKGLKVEDMVKVMQKGKFYNEDGIIRRLKDGQLFVRFYTYGTMFEEWLHPNDVRKLTAEEVLRGLSGSTQPITQKDFDQNNGIIDPRSNTMNRPIDVREALRSSGISGSDRNRRQDRTVDRYKNNKLNEQRDADKNWDWYKEQQQRTKKQDSVVGSDSEWVMRAGSSDTNNNQRNKNWVESDVDSQWGRKPQRQIRKEIHRTSSNNSNYVDNRLTKAAIDGTADWNAFVSPSLSTPSNNEADDFFASLMSDLKKDLDPASRDNHRSQPKQQMPDIRQRSEPILDKNNANSADDFFSSLLSDLNKNLDSSTPYPDVNQAQKQNSHSIPSLSDSSSDDDFFASLVSDLKTNAMDTAVVPPSSPSDLTSSSKSTQQQIFRPTGESANNKNNDYTIQQDDDFFAILEAELESSLRTNNNVNSVGKDEIFTSENSSQDIFPSTKSDDEPKTSLEASSTYQPLSSNLTKKTIPMLKEMLRDRGLKVSGTKSELIDRLLNA
jgi:transcription antitermination factor NusG